MKTFIVAASMIMALAAEVKAQSYTYNHDEMKKTQITVMESGTGSLTPEWYYKSLHESYAENANEKNKGLYRANAGAALNLQIEHAEAIDSAMSKRASIEALNMADRVGGAADLAWATEGDKVTAKMNSFMGNINRIVSTGGSMDERNYWLQYYNVYSSAIRNTQDAYMPNAQRKREYLRIYADVNQKNDMLVKYLVRIHNRSRIQEMLSTLADTCKADKPSITQMALARWKASVGMTSGRIIE